MLTGQDPFGATSSLPSDRAWAEGFGLLIWMIGLWSVSARYAWKACPPARPPRRSVVTAPVRRWWPAPDVYPRSAMTDQSTLYDRAGGTPFFEALVGRFYAGVAEDPLLRTDLSRGRPRAGRTPA